MRITLMTTLMASALALGTAANAQQTQPRDTQAQQPSQQQQSGQQPEGADIQVQQAPPEVIVRQPEPQITVTQPEPQVTVTQPEPKVTIEQGEPTVSVTQQGEPEVRIEGQSQTEQLTEEQRQQRAQEAQTGAATTQTETMTTGDAQTAGLDQLMNKEVYGSDGEQVGDISDVLIDDQGQPQMVIVEHGGFLGIGSREVAFEMNQVQLQGDQVQVPATKDQISEMPEWDEGQVTTRGYTSQRVTTGPAGQTGQTGTTGQTEASPTTTTTTRPAD